MFRRVHGWVAIVYEQVHLVLLATDQDAMSTAGRPTSSSCSVSAKVYGDLLMITHHSFLCKYICALCVCMCVCDDKQI